MASQLAELNEQELAFEINYLEKTLKELESIRCMFPPATTQATYKSIATVTAKAIAKYRVELQIRKVETLLSGAK